MTTFEQYFLLIFCSWGIFLVFAVLHTVYRLLKKLWQKPKFTEVSPAEMLQMPFTAVEFKSSQSIALLQFISAVVVLTAIFIFYKSLFPIEKAFGGKSPFSLSNLTESSRNSLMWASGVLYTWWGVFKFSFGGTKYHVLEEGFTPKNADGKACPSYPMLIPWETVEKVSIEAEPRRFNYFSCKFVFHGKAPDYFKKTEFSGQQIVYDFAYVSRSDLEKAKDAISRRVIVEYTEID